MKTAKECYDRRVFCNGEVMECSVLKELERSTKETVGWTAVKMKETSFCNSQRKRTGEREKRVKISEERPAVLRLQQGKRKVGKERDVEAAVRVELERAVGR